MYLEVASRTKDAYSFNRYANWSVCAKKLATECGLTDNQIEAVLRSKWMRWAADGSSAPYGKVPAKAIVDFVKKQGQHEVEMLTIETLGVQA